MFQMRLMNQFVVFFQSTADHLRLNLFYDRECISIFVAFTFLEHT